MSQKQFYGPCGCGRSPTGKCIGWHELSERTYLEELSKYELEELEKQKKTFPLSGNEGR